MKSQCDNCGKICDAEDGALATIHRLWERLEPGGVVPSGECDVCGALVYPVRNEDADLRAAVGTLLEGLINKIFAIETNLAPLERRVGLDTEEAKTKSLEIIADIRLSIEKAKTLIEKM